MTYASGDTDGQRRDEDPAEAGYSCGPSKLFGTDKDGKVRGHRHELRPCPRPAAAALSLFVMLGVLMLRPRHHWYLRQPAWNRPRPGSRRPETRCWSATKRRSAHDNQTLPSAGAN